MKHWLIKNRQGNEEIILSPSRPANAVMLVPKELEWKKVKLETFEVEEEFPIIDEETGEPRLDDEGKPLTETIVSERQRVVLDEDEQAKEDARRQELEGQRQVAEVARQARRATIGDSRLPVQERFEALLDELGLGGNNGAIGPRN
jgi:hypothetical protein